MQKKFSWFYAITYYFFILLGLDVSSARAERQIKASNYTVHEFNQLMPEKGTYHVSGYLAEKFPCPVCPKDALCKPCAGEYIHVVTKNRLRRLSSELTEDDILIFVDSAQLGLLKKQKKYHFLVQVLDVKTMNQILPNLKLIYAE